MLLNLYRSDRIKPLRFRAGIFFKPMKLPILNYHGIQSFPGEYAWTEGERSYVVDAANFTAQLDYLKESGFQTLSLDALSQWLPTARPEKSVVITFDDGHLSHFDYALGCLKLRSFNGIFFVTAGFVGQPGYLSWEHLHEIIEEGLEVGSHGLNHIPLPGLPQKKLDEEVKVSKQLLEQTLGVEIKSFSVPRGFYHSRIRTAVNQAGYRFLFTSHFDLISRGADAMKLGRLAILGNTSLEVYKRWLHGNLGAKRYTEKMKSWTRECVPPVLYAGLSDFKRRFIKK